MTDHVDDDRILNNSQLIDLMDGDEGETIGLGPAQDLTPRRHQRQQSNKRASAILAEIPTFDASSPKRLRLFTYCNPASF